MGQLYGAGDGERPPPAFEIVRLMRGIGDFYGY